MFNDKLKKYSIFIIITLVIGLVINLILMFAFSLQNIGVDKDACDKKNLDMYNKLVSDEYKATNSNDIIPKVYQSHKDKKLVDIKNKDCVYWQSDFNVCTNGIYSEKGFCNIDSSITKVIIPFILSIIFLILLIISIIFHYKK